MDTQKHFKRTNIQVNVSDSISVTATLFEADLTTGQSENPQQIVILINSAMAVQRNYYDKFAEFMADRGFIVLTYDYEDIGDSRSSLPISKSNVSLKDWGTRDLTGVLNWLSNKYPQATVVTINHSIGALLLGVADGVERLGACVVVASGTGYWKLWDGPNRLKLLFGWYFLLPTLISILGYMPAHFFGENLPKRVALGWVDWCKDPDGRPFTDGLKRIGCPILFLSFTDDKYSPPKAAANLMRHFKQETLQHIQMNPANWNVSSIGHFGYFKKSAPATAWDQLAAWIESNVTI